ncbi:MAG: SIR2 family protein [Methylobacter sp.]|nr:SIR2 family protein [Methylobacter sp.]
MKGSINKRAVILFGAGASIEYNAPSTSGLTDVIEQKVMADEWMKSSGGDKAFSKIKDGLKNYLKHPGIVQFEQIYHCVHELIYSFEPTSGAFDEFRPLLYPFFTNNTGLDECSLRSLAKKMVEVIFAEVSACCNGSPISLDPLTSFIKTLQDQYITRIYTTNYDDFPLQAVADMYTGFDSTLKPGSKRFDVDQFWNKEDLNSIFHLHGSVHMGFPHPIPPEGDIGELYWFDDRAEALQHCSFSGSDIRRMDGSSYLRTAVITGLDKLSRIQQRPLSHFYSAMARDIMQADVIFVIGSGLGDLHLNTWLKESRLRKPATPLLFVDWWEDGFLETVEFDFDRKEIEMLHALRILIGSHYPSIKYGSGWTVSNDQSAAVWDKGFQSFLNTPAELQDVMKQLKL